jgi:hypothetical protein
MHKNEWDIKPCSKSCAHCGLSFKPYEHYTSVLLYNQQGYTRKDFCDKCWLQQNQEPNTISVWKGIFKPPPAPEKPPVEHQTAESLLRKLIAEQNSENSNVIFILAVMLERKKLFIEKKVITKDSQIRRVYEHKKTGESFIITDPKLSLHKIEEVQRNVINLLSTNNSKV